MMSEQFPDLQQNRPTLDQSSGTTFPAAPVAIKPTKVAAEVTADRPDDGSKGLSTSGAEPSMGASQHGVDRKAFKGRGAVRRMLKARRAVDKVHSDMRSLAEATKSIKNRTFYLAIHSRGATGQLSLRWRRAGVSDTSHISWDDLDSYLCKLPDELAHWYQVVNRLALGLNAQEKHNRSVLKHETEVAEKMNPPTITNIDR